MKDGSAPGSVMRISAASRSANRKKDVLSSFELSASNMECRLFSSMILLIPIVSGLADVRPSLKLTPLEETNE